LLRPALGQVSLCFRTLTHYNMTLQTASTQLAQLLQAQDVSPVVPIDLNSSQILKLNLTATNTDLEHVDLKNTAAFTSYVFGLLEKAGAVAAVGGYFEPRVVYRRSEAFNEGNTPSRSVHLGVDIWAEAGTPVMAPLAGKVHSFANNARFGDYGPTIILEHTLGGITFYTLYGHLGDETLPELEKGMPIEKGQQIATIGPYPVNGDWPPHLHFQVMLDMQGMQGDYPGVCTPADLESFKSNCPDPNLILRSRHLV
jgi:peptidoglycan LD-endopeptidase LytH